MKATLPLVTASLPLSQLAKEFRNHKLEKKLTFKLLIWNETDEILLLNDDILIQNNKFNYAEISNKSVLFTPQIQYSLDDINWQNEKPSGVNCHIRFSFDSGASWTSSIFTTGIKGDRGCKGDQGIKGDQGDQGLRGYKGDCGDKGDQGIKGDHGDKGYQGITGNQGDKGDQGIKGDQGDMGIKGIKGDQGDQGLRGYKGDCGDKGDQGIKGDHGDKGYQGVKGNQGDKGARGALFYTDLTVDQKAEIAGVKVKPNLLLDGNFALLKDNPKTAQIQGSYLSGMFKYNYNKPYSVLNTFSAEAMPNGGGRFLINEINTEAPPTAMFLMNTLDIHRHNFRNKTFTLTFRARRNGNFNSQLMLRYNSNNTLASTFLTETMTTYSHTFITPDIKSTALELLLVNSGINKPLEVGQSFEYEFIKIEENDIFSGQAYQSVASVLKDWEYYYRKFDFLTIIKPSVANISIPLYYGEMHGTPTIKITKVGGNALEGSFTGIARNNMLELLTTNDFIQGQYGYFEIELDARI